MTEIQTTPLKPNLPSSLRQIAIAVLAVILAALVKLLLPASLSYPFLIFFTAVVISAWFGGLLAGLLATALSAILVVFLFTEPIYSITLNRDQLVQILLFCFEGGLMSIFSHRLNKAYRDSIEEIARHERIETALRESEERFRLLVEKVSDYAIFMLDPDGIITSWNAGAERAKGYSAAEIIGKPLETLYTPEDAAEGTAQKLMQRAIKDGSAEAEGWRIRKDGSRFWAHITLTALWEGGKLRGFAKITRDMTERKRAEEISRSLEIERIARQEAERANQLKMRFLAMISHELRTPLTSIKGFTTTLLADDVTWTPEQYHQFLTVINEESDKLHELIHHLLDLSQIQAGVLQIQAEPQPFRTSLDIARQQIATIMAQRSLEVHIPDTLPNVNVDAHRIAQVVTNIIQNAVKFTPQDSRITLTASVVKGKVEIAIHDEGPGIPKDQRESVFEAFNQLDRKSNQYHGVGLGLAICKGIVEAHGGSIWVKDDPPPGATIAFTLPLAEVAVFR